MIQIVACVVSSETPSVVVVDIANAKHSLSSSSSLSLMIVMLTQSTLPSSDTVSVPLASVKSPGAIHKKSAWF